MQILIIFFFISSLTTLSLIIQKQVNWLRKMTLSYQQNLENQLLLEKYLNHGIAWLENNLQQNNKFIFNKFAKTLKIPNSTQKKIELTFRLIKKNKTQAKYTITANLKNKYNALSTPLCAEIEFDNKNTLKNTYKFRQEA